MKKTILVLAILLWPTAAEAQFFGILTKARADQLYQTAGAGTELQRTDGSGGHVAVTGSSVAGGEVTLGDALVVDGSTDQVQLTVQGATTQTSNILLVEKSDGTDLLTVSNSGRIVNPNTGRFEIANSVMIGNEFFGSGLRIPAIGDIRWSTSTALNSGDTRLYRPSAGLLSIEDTAGNARDLSLRSLSATAQATPPVTCNAGNLGYQYTDDSSAMCWCSGTAWVVVAGAGTCS